MSVATQAQPAPRERSAPLKVMIVDDDADIRILLGTLMGMEGFDVVGIAENGEAGVILASETRPDVVILDYMMPKIDGEEAAKFIRAILPEARILAFSGVIHTLPEWADDFIEKGDIADMAKSITG